MLVLGRSVNEKVMIGDNICIYVLSIHGKDVRLGFEAPHNVEIHRSEVFEKVKAETQTPVIVGNLVTKKVPVKSKDKGKLLKLQK